MLSATMDAERRILASDQYVLNELDMSVTKKMTASFVMTRKTTVWLYLLELSR